MTDRDLGQLTWAEQVIIRRVRLGWDKKKLADEAGITRMTLWRLIECKDPARRMTATQDTIARIDQALATGEAAAAEAAADRALSAAG